MSNVRKASDYLKLGESIGRAGCLLDRAIKDAEDGGSLVALNLKNGGGVCYRGLASLIAGGACRSFGWGVSPLHTVLT